MTNPNEPNPMTSPAPESSTPKNATRTLGDIVRHQEYAAAREFIHRKYPNGGIDPVGLAEFSLERNEYFRKIAERSQEIVTAVINTTVMPPIIVTNPPASCSERKAINVCPVHGDTGNEPCAACYKPPCSEVVERLRHCVNGHSDGRHHGYTFDSKKAEKILHEWRERRVQELEEALSGLVRESVVLSKDYLETVSVGLRDSNTVQGWDIARWKRLIAAKELAEKALAKSDGWREQIRKGAKHE